MGDKMKRIALIALVCCLAPLPASAGTITLNWGTTTPVTLTYDNTITKFTGAADVLLTPTGVAGLADGVGFYTFCVDVQHWSQSHVGATLASMADWNTVQERNGTAAALDYQLRGASYLGLQYYALPSRPADLVTRAAYQIAIWELLYRPQTGPRRLETGIWLAVASSSLVAFRLKSWTRRNC